jgi:hypothetical protein
MPSTGTRFRQLKHHSKRLPDATQGDGAAYEGVGRHLSAEHSASKRADRRFGGASVRSGDAGMPSPSKDRPVEEAMELAHKESLEEEGTHATDEARMILPGVQAILGFQLIAVFNQRFQELTEGRQFFILPPGADAQTDRRRCYRQGSLKSAARRRGSYRPSLERGTHPLEASSVSPRSA